MKKSMKNAGFTLVELIVVIAILGILAGVGTVAYTGYMEKANKAVDQQLVADIEYAMQLAYASDPSFVGTGVIVLGETGTSAKPTGDSATATWLSGAMQRAFGDDWTSLTLQYKNWGNSATAAKDAIAHFEANKNDPTLGGIYSGTTTLSYANRVDELFELVKDTAVDIGDGKGAELVQGAAGITMNLGSADFANYWASSAWDSKKFMGDEKDGSYNEDAGKLEGTDLDNAIANAATIKARNTALATYLRNAGVNENLCNYIENYTYGTSRVPKDMVGDFLVDDSALNTKITSLVSSSDEFQTFSDSINKYYGLDSYSGTPATETQAYKDGLGYYAMMQTVTAVNENNSDDDTYWNEMKGAVSLYASLLDENGSTSLNDLDALFDGSESNTNSILVIVQASTGDTDIYVNSNVMD